MLARAFYAIAATIALPRHAADAANASAVVRASQLLVSSEPHRSERLSSWVRYQQNLTASLILVICITNHAYFTNHWLEGVKEDLVRREQISLLHSNPEIKERK